MFGKYARLEKMVDRGHRSIVTLDALRTLVVAVGILGICGMGFYASEQRVPDMLVATYVIAAGVSLAIYNVSTKVLIGGCAAAMLNRIDPDREV